MELAIEEYQDVMVDLETMGTRPGDAVLSIGAVLFDRQTKTLGLSFRVNLDIEQVMAAGFACAGSTMQWWLGQPEEARTALLERPTNIINALTGFAEFLTDGEGGVNKGLKFWGNGAAFDNTLLRTMYQKLGMREPWEFWNDRCFRTLKNEHPKRKELEPHRGGVFHNAHDDAVHQAKWAINLFHNERVFTGHEVSGQIEMDLAEESDVGPDVELGAYGTPEGETP